VLNQEKINELLAYFARKIIAKYHPMVIGITGSVGKTSTRHAIAAALSAKYNLREPEKNYNNEIGIPLTVIGARGVDEDTSFIARKFAWLRIFTKALAVWLLPQNYPKLLVLEYGIDHPGDMDSLLNIVAPQLAVLTTIGVSHKQFFKSEDAIAFEKGKIVVGLPKNGTFIFNADDVHVAAQAERTQAHLMPFGHASSASVSLVAVEENLQLPASTKLTIKTPTREIKITVPVVGTAHTSAILAAVAVAEAMEVETDLIIKGLANYRAMPGRLNIITGIKRSILIDDTYNAAPLSTIEALKLLGRFSNKNKIAVLGDMLELGDATDLAHAEIGQLAAGLNLSKLVTVGELGQKIAVAAQAAGMSAENILSFTTSDEAKQAVLNLLEPESVVLIKGSQGVRMEKITKELLAEPTAASQLLVRQYGKWIK
jgi:UDP-N-acetylmuramoyl-tripeptide--D-alanyl-D-alanine ligase